MYRVSMVLKLDNNHGTMYVAILIAIHPTEDLLATGHIYKPLVMLTYIYIMRGIMCILSQSCFFVYVQYIANTNNI